MRSPFSRMVWNSQSLKAEAGVGVHQAGEAEQARGEGAENELLALLGLLDALIMARYSGAAGEITSFLLGPDTWKSQLRGVGLFCLGSEGCSLSWKLGSSGRRMRRLAAQHLSSGSRGMNAVLSPCSTVPHFTTTA